MRFLIGIVASALSLLPLQSLAVIYKCVDGDGSVTYMNAHCGKGAKIIDTEINVLESVLRKKESYASDVPPPRPLQTALMTIVFARSVRNEGRLPSHFETGAT